MPASFLQLWRLDLTGVAEAAHRWHALSQELEHAHTQHQRQVTGPLKKDGWTGEAADAAFGFMTGVENRLAIGRIEAETVHAVLDTVHQRMTRAHNDLRTTVREAESNGYSVDDDGTISPPRVHNRYEAADQEPELAGYRQRIAAALSAAEEASNEGRNALAILHGDIMGQYRPHAFNEAGTDAQSAMDVLGIGTPHPPKDPDAAAKWWHGLSPDQQRDYTLFYPQLIGSTDGLPATVRNDANRIWLDEQLDNPDFATGHDAGIATTTPIDPRYGNLMSLKLALDSYDTAPPGRELYLLGFSAGGDGKAVVAMGDPDTATHVGVYVPGTGNTITSTAGGLKRIDLLQQAAGLAHPSGPVSTVYWLGYNAPEMPSVADLGIATTTRADNGAPAFRRFIQGTRAAQGPAHHHITVIGHSYGSTLVGSAAKGGHLGADDIVVVGSPGMEITNVTDLGMPADHVYAGASPHDPIVKWTSNLTLGPDPTTTDFGANEITVAPGDHSSYFNQGTDGLLNMGRIIAGKTPTLLHAAQGPS
ncbi:alpha/beta hydrolase [Streptomyces sp. HPF1205]|uniref:alpha/beta hydrolase n=1 Tax=Streptomyces sp. HPF1205 TaxID=2873262 RepID=UPI001CED74E9|nr:alpha/beta hydrolase [Streptomyces sp. HPF1205]